MLWPDVVEQALVSLGGVAHRLELHEVVLRLGLPNGSVSNDIQKSIDDTLGKYSSNSGRRSQAKPGGADDRFERLGRGRWRARNYRMPLPTTPPPTPTSVWVDGHWREAPQDLHSLLSAKEKSDFEVLRQLAGFMNNPAVEVFVQLRLRH